MLFMPMCSRRAQSYRLPVDKEPRSKDTSLLAISKGVHYEESFVVMVLHRQDLH